MELTTIILTALYAMFVCFGVHCLIKPKVTPIPKDTVEPSVSTETCEVYNRIKAAIAKYPDVTRLYLEGELDDLGTLDEPQIERLSDILSNGGLDDVYHWYITYRDSKRIDEYSKVEQPVKAIAQAMWLQYKGLSPRVDSGNQRFKVCKKNKGTVIDTSCNTKFKLHRWLTVKVFSGSCGDLSDSLNPEEHKLMAKIINQVVDLEKERLEELVRAKRDSERTKLRNKLNNLYNVESDVKVNEDGSVDITIKETS